MKNHIRLIKTQVGFTIVEIMIVVGIVALLATITIPNLIRARIEAHDAAAKAALKSIATALETYAAAHSQYPPNTTSLLGVVPPYLSVDYFTGVHSGFTFTSGITPSTYSLTAYPFTSNLGSRSFSITTGGLLTEN